MPVHKGPQAPERESYTEVDESEVSVAGDQQSIEELRKNIPPEVRDRNDTLKMILSLMGEVKVHPQKVRQKFNKFQRKRRTKFQKEHRKKA